MGTLLIATPLCPVEFKYSAEGLCSLRLLPRKTVASPSNIDGPDWLKRLAQQTERHLSGDSQDLLWVPLDLPDVSPFARGVYDRLRTVSAGQTVSYGQLAEMVRRPGSARAVARVMATNPVPLVVPCHRVLGANGRLTGFSGADGRLTKALLLHREGVLARFGPNDLGDASIFEPAVYRLAMDVLKQDEWFARLLTRAGEVEPVQGYADNPFASLVQAVCYQQLAGAAAATIFGRVKDVLGGDPTPEAVLNTSPDDLAGAGLSAAKHRAILGLAHAVAEKRVNLAELRARPYKEIVDALTQVPGIGPWTVEMFAIFHLGLPDIFSPGDLGIRKALTGLSGRAALVSPEEAQRMARRWRPFSTLATLALWRSLGTVTL